MAEPVPILLVDDDPIMRRTLNRRLQTWGYHLQSFEVAEQALQCLQSVTVPCVVLTDWLLPGMDGLEFCRQLRQQPWGGARYVIMLTARGDSTDRNDALEAGADAFLSKPVDPQDLQASLRVGLRVCRLHLQSEERLLALERERLRTRGMLTTATDGVVVADREGRIIELNPAAEALLEGTREELCGRLMAETMIPEELREAHTLGLQRYLATREPRLLGKVIEVEAQTLRGRRFPVELSINVHHEEEQPVFTAFLRDITQRKRAEAELRAATLQLQAAREREVAVAGRIQSTLLVETPPVDLELDVAVLSSPSQPVDGDFIQFSRVEYESLDVVIGDVMGKGVPAALLGAALKACLLRVTLELTSNQQQPTTEQIVNQVHGLMSRELMRLDSFATLCYLRLDKLNRELRYVDAGHTKSLHWEASSRAVHFLEGDGMPLGFSATEHYREVVRPLREGDWVLLYSDGVCEMRNAQGQMLGTERLSESVREWSDLSPREFLERLDQLLREYGGGGPARDDLSCVAIKVQALAPPARVLRQWTSAAELQQVTWLRESVLGVVALHWRLYPEDVWLHLLGLAVTETITNIVRHAYGGQGGELTQTLELLSDRLRVRLSHAGLPLDSRLQGPPADLLEPQEGGMGLFLIHQSVDEVRYGVDGQGRGYVELVKYAPQRRG